MNVKEKRYILILVILLVLCIIILISTNWNKSDKELYKKEDNKVLILLVGQPLDNDKLKKAYKNYDVIEFMSGEEVSPEEWNKLATAIFDVYKEYDAFVILHNPETITYTASALSFMLENLNKTVVVTSNAILGMNFATNYTIPEVVICDGDKIIRGCRSKKLKNAVISSNYAYLGNVKNKIELENDKILSNPTEPLKFLPVDPRKKIVVFKLFPGIDGKYLLGALKEQKVYGVILESYTSGYVSGDQNLIKIIAEAVKNGVIFVNVSQTGGNVTDKSLEDIGVICGKDMTTEAALAKLYLIFSNVENINHSTVSQLMNISMRGECN